jgi:glycosyltransferase involved in cell wall biosynthesis
MPSNILDNFPQAPPNKNGWPWENRINIINNSNTNELSKVTIVTPSYNQGEFLEETIRSVLLQDYPNLEYIVIDGGSIDSSVEIIQKYSPWLSFWVSEPDLGQADAINKGFKKSSGEFLGWLNSDDYLYPTAISQVVKAFKEDKFAEMIYGDVEKGWNNKAVKTKLYGRQIEFKEMLKTIQVPIPQQGCLWKKSVIERIGTLDTKWQVALDREFFTRAAEKCQLRYLSTTLGFFRYHEDSKSISLSYLWLNELPIMYQEFFQRADLDKRLMELKSETMGMVYMTCSSIALRSGRKYKAIYYFFKAIKSDYIVLLRKNFIKKLLIRIIRVNIKEKK